MSLYCLKQQNLYTKIECHGKASTAENLLQGNVDPKQRKLLIKQYILDKM